MPQSRNSETPPKVMTWPEASWVLIAAGVFDLLRAFFNLFWFFGPAIAALYCSSTVSDMVGSVWGLTKVACDAAAIAAGVYFSPVIASFGVIMADAVALLGYLLLTALVLGTNARILKTVQTAMMQIGASFGVAALPFIGAIPTFTITLYKLYRRQIKLEKAAYKKWEKAHATEQLQQREQQAAEITQSRNAQAVQMLQQDAANDEISAEAEQEKEPREVMREKRYEPAPARTIPRLATVPNYTGTAKPLDENRYQKFASEEKARWAEYGANPLTEAANARRFAKIDLESEQQSVEKYRERVENLRSNIHEKKSSLIGRVLDFRQIQMLERGLSAAERAQSSAEQMAKSREELFTAYDRIVSEQQKLGTLLEESSKENMALDERKRLEFVEEEKKRDVGNLARIHNTYFVNDIVDAEWKPSANNRAINTKNLTWNDQLDILIGLHPSIPVSTIDPGSKHRTFGGDEGTWGAFISGGRALGGGRSDIGSVAVGLRDRRLTSKNDEGVKAIEDAITDRGNSGYNEIVVDQPDVAGVYYRWPKKFPPLTEETSLQKGSGASDGWWERMRDIMDRNIPIFVLDENNQAHLIHDMDFEKRTFKVAAGLTPEDVQNMPGIYKQHIGSEEEKAAVGRVFDSVSHLLSDEEKMRFAPLPKAVNDEIPEGVRKAA